MNEPSKSIWKRLLTTRIKFFLVFLLTIALLLIELVWSENILRGEPLFFNGSWTAFALVVLMLVTLLAMTASFFCFVSSARVREKLFSQRVLRMVFFGVACVVTLTALLYAIENWRGRRAWNQYVEQFSLAGEPLNLKDLAPKPIPDEQNLAAAPLLKPVFDWTRIPVKPGSKTTTIKWNDTNGVARLDRLTAWTIPETFSEQREIFKRMRSENLTNGWMNLSLWQEYYRLGTSLNDFPATNAPAVDILLALRDQEGDLAELRREAQQRPLSQWPVEYVANNPFAILLPHLAKIRTLCKLLQLRAAAHLALGNSDSAIAELILGHRLAESASSEPIFISQLVRAACHEFLAQSLKEGLARHQFSEAQLIQLQNRFQPLDFLVAYQNGIRGERALNSTLSQLTPSDIRDLISFLNTQGGSSYDHYAVLAAIVPRGWIYQNQLSVCRFSEEFLMPAVNVQAGTAHPERVDGIIEAIEKTKGPYTTVLRLSVNATKSFGDMASWSRRFAYVQTQLNQARIACALERYHLQHKQYPDALESIKPFMDRIPHDVMSGQPLKYRRTEDGRYVLYSIGWNQTDEGGKVVFDNGKVDNEQGDWVWELPRPL
jgi:hypothetical protein